MTIYIGTGAQYRHRGLVEENSFAVNGASRLGRIVNVAYHFDTAVSVFGQVGPDIDAVAVADITARCCGAGAKVCAMITLKSTRIGVAGGGVQRSIVDRSGGTMAIIALQCSNACIGKQ